MRRNNVCQSLQNSDMLKERYGHTCSPLRRIALQGTLGRLTKKPRRRLNLHQISKTTFGACLLYSPTPTLVFTTECFRRHKGCVKKPQNYLHHLASGLIQATLL